MKKYVVILFGLVIILGSLAGTAGAEPLTHTVKSGDSLWTLAQKHGTTVDELKAINGLKTDSLKIGQLLQLGTAPVPQPVLASPSGDSIHIVQVGDCLGGIALKHAMTVEELKALNGLKSDLIQCGQTLKVTRAQAVAETMPAASEAAPAALQGQYILQPGDSLTSIAAKYSTSVSYLKQMNNLESDILDAGTVLSVPAQAVAVSRSGDSSRAAIILKTAAQHLGTPYKYAGSGPGGFDCSGFTSYVFKQSGHALPHTAAGQYGLGSAVEKSHLLPGDLVFFACYGSGIDHVGIYSGGGEFIHSSSPRSGGVIYSSLSGGFYANTYVGARRII